MKREESARKSNRQVLLKHRPNGIPTAEHFEIVESPIPLLKQGRVLIRNLYLSVDPAMRGWVSTEANYADPVPLGAVMRSLAVGRVEQSRNPGYSKGDIVTGMFGWQDYMCADDNQIDRKVKETDLPMSTALGILGLNGLTAYFGMMRVGKPKAGETVVVSAAALLPRSTKSKSQNQQKSGGSRTVLARAKRSAP